MSGFVAVHCGAGYHKSVLHPKYKKLCKKACQAASDVLKAGGSALYACQVAVMVLEDDPITNAGFGSNLTISGEVECDASVMDGETLNFGACGAVKGVKYPVSLATQICRDQATEHPLGLIPPLLLVGQGAHDFAKLSNLTLVDNKQMISRNAFVRHKKNVRLLKNHATSKQFQAMNTRLDTVGAVCVDGRGHVASACSSGGVSLKYNGRVGQAATYACGIWADSANNKSENSVAVSTSGVGEYLIKTLLAKELGKNIKNSQFPVNTFRQTLKNEFLESRYLKDCTERLGGALALHVSPMGYGELMWGHTTKTMGFGYLDVSTNKSKGVISELPPELEGTSTMVSGVSFKLNFT